MTRSLNHHSDFGTTWELKLIFVSHPSRRDATSVERKRKIVPVP